MTPLRARASPEALHFAQLRITVLGCLIAGLLPRIANADPLDNWSARSSPFPYSPNLIGVAYGNGRFAAVPRDTSLPAALTSPDGINWTASILPVRMDYIHGITFGNGEFVVAGWSVTPVSSWAGQALVSADGVAWTNHLRGVTNSAVATFGGVAFGRGTFVAVDTTTITTSTNGVDWVTKASGVTLNLRAVTYGLGKFIAVGYRALS